MRSLLPPCNLGLLLWKGFVVDAYLKRSHELKQALTDFVFDADGELAEALEAYAASQSRRLPQGISQRDLIIDNFLIEGKVGEKTPIDLFIEDHPKLSQSDRDIINSWQRSFLGLFTVSQILPDGFDLTNWLTNKHYTVKFNNPKTQEQIKRFKQGEILLTRITPVTDNYYTFFGAYIALGNLGKPKLAVAIGNFKDNYKSSLYSDAPELLEQAWKSVEQYHQDFIDFFGSDEVTMPGYQFSKKLAEFQETLTKTRLAAAGVDSNKSLDELAQEAGISEEEMKEAAQEAGVDNQAVSQIFSSNGTNKMVMPKVELPEQFKKAEQVTALTHPLWGQMFLTTYSQFKTLLEAEDWQSISGYDKLIRQYLEDATINAFIWHRLAQEYPSQLEKVLQTFLEHPDFKIDRDLDTLLQEHNKPLEPELPDIASVPIHLHNLFQEAVAEVNKSKPKGKNKKPAGKGFSLK